MLDVVASPLISAGSGPRSDLRRRLRIGFRVPVYTLRQIKNDRCGNRRLSKIAHMETRDCGPKRNRVQSIVTSACLAPFRGAQSRNI